MTPCGIFASMHGSFTGRRADGFVFRDTRINAKVAELERICGFPVKTHVDSAYAVASNTVKGGGYQMSRSRECVEWGFGLVCSLWAGIDWDRKLQLYLNRPGSLYLTAGILTNMHVCLYGSLTSRYFSCWPPFTLEEYMRM
jgi:hypothetical protein